MALFGSNINIKGFNKGYNPEIEGDNSTLINGDVKVYIGNLGWNMATEKHKKCFEHEAGALLRDLQSSVGEGVYMKKLDEINNYKAVGYALRQANDFSGDPERRELLRNLILEKFKTEEDDGIYLDAIIAMDKLKQKDLRVLATIAFVMILSSRLSEESIILQKKSILALLEEVGELEETQLEKLRGNGLLYPLFPKVFDISGLERLKGIDEQIYVNCVQWVERNEFVSEFKLTLLGCLIARNLFSVVYDLNYESVYMDVQSLKYTDLNVGNINAKGNVVAGGTMSMGSLS